jgi:hypothetical protein
VKRSWYRRIGVFVGVVAIVASGVYIASVWRHQDLHAFASARGVAGLAVGAVFYLVGVIATAGAWRLLLGQVGIDKPWGELAGILAVTQVGKYLPGNVAQHVGRATMGFSRGINPSRFALTVGIEIGLLTLASAVVGVTAFFFSSTSMAVLAGHTRMLVTGVILGAPLAILAVVAAARFGPGLVRRHFPRIASVFDSGLRVSPIAMLAAFAIYCLVYLVFGLGIVLMAGMLLPAVAQDGWLLVGSFALAWIIGFVTPGAPAGLGVREGAIMFLLGTYYPAAAAAMIAVALRIATTLGDVALLPLGIVLLRRYRAGDPVST